MRVVAVELFGFLLLFFRIVGTVVETRNSDDMVEVLARGLLYELSPGTRYQHFNGCSVRIANGRKIFSFEISRHRPSCSVLDFLDLDDFSDLKNRRLK
jgi:hypothetical protein